MPLSYRNIIDGAELENALSSGDFSGVLKKPKIQARYIKGYAENTALEGLANTLNINKGLFKQAFGLEDKKLDAYDPYHTSDAKKEEGWYGDINGPIQPGQSSFRTLDGKTVQKDIDEDTNTFKRSLFSEYYNKTTVDNFQQSDFWYEDPFIPKFELYFDMNSPFFVEINKPNFIPNVKTKLEYAKNSLQYFMLKYSEIDPTGYSSRYEIWKEFKNTFFKIFEKLGESRNFKNKPYYITNISGLANLNKKFIKYGGTDGDKITITLNEDVSMISWYIAELYNNLVYSYKNQRYMFPENLLRFNMQIRINDMRNFVIPIKNNSLPDNKKYQYMKSPKSQIVYTLNDCNFNFFESKNYGEDLTIGGYVGAQNTTPSQLSFNIYFKSVTRYSEFPLQTPLQSPGNIYTPGTINGWNSNLSNDPIRTEQQPSTYLQENAKFSEELIRSTNATTAKSFTNSLLSKAGQSVANNALNYMDNLEAKLREVRGSVVNNALQQFNNSTGVNKIEPDNVYNSDFNNRISIKNFGKQMASSLLTDLTDTARNAANF